VEKYLGPERVRLEHTLVSLDREGEDGLFVAKFDTPEGEKIIKAKSVSLTSPTATTSKVASNLVPAASRLSEIYSPPVASVTIAYPKSAFKEVRGGEERSDELSAAI